MTVIHFHDETLLSDEQARLVEIYRRDGAKVLTRDYVHHLPDGSALEFKAGFTYVVDADSMVVPVVLTPLPAGA